MTARAVAPSARLGGCSDARAVKAMAGRSRNGVNGSIVRAS